MRFELILLGFMAALYVVRTRAHLAQYTALVRPVGSPSTGSNDRADTRPRRPASISLVDKGVRPERAVLLCRWQRNPESGRLEARWMALEAKPLRTVLRGPSQPLRTGEPGRGRRA